MSLSWLWASRRSKSVHPPKNPLRLENLEDRITPSWSGTPPLTISPPSNPTAVAFNTQNVAAGNAAITANENDFYRFVAPVTGSYLLEATAIVTRMDTVLGLYSSNGQRLGFNDDISNTNRNSRLSISLSAGTTYLLGITNFVGTVNGNYGWRITGPAPLADDSYENNDTSATANNLGTLTASRTINNLVMADGNDWFRFTMNGPGTTANFISISTTSTQGDLDLELYNVGGTRLATSGGTTNNERVALNGLAAGTYLVRVLGYRNLVTPNYSLTINPGVQITPPPTSGGFRIDIEFTGGLTVSQQSIFRQAAARWEAVITGDLPDATYNGRVVDDVLIGASGASIDGSGGVLGQAGPDGFRSGNWLPYHGIMEFDSADLASLESSGQLLDVITHEMGHVLGIGTIWSQLGLLSGAGTNDPRFTGRAATAEYNRIFNTTGSVPVENTGGAGTRDSHWRESLFGNELMTGYLNSGARNPLSRVTVGALQDMGYQVNLDAADAYSPP